jgi:cytoplasmic iron level regulating protein YaaA (DUF328/UPF0246 family)
VLILLPPSEGKAAPRRGRPLDLATLSAPELTETRSTLLDALVRLCTDDPDKAREVLGLTPGLAGEVARNAALRSAPTTTAGRLYTGVLYDALGLESLSPSARRRATSRLLVTSALFGLVRTGDRVPPYRLSGDVTLPGVGTVASAWRGPLDAVLAPAARRHLVVDLRSGTYAAFWRPPAEARPKVVTVRVVHDDGTKRSIVSHFNKATKGRIVRALLEDGRDARTPAAFARLLADLGWTVETPRSPHELDVIVRAL